MAAASHSGHPCANYSASLNSQLCYSLVVSKNHIIYLPGIGDHKPYYQPQIINLWKNFGVIAHYHPVIWRGNEVFAPKLDRIVALVDQLYAEGHRVSLVGVSAGATAAFNAYMKRSEKIARVVYVCGKLRRPESVGEQYYRINPAFKQSLEMVQGQIDKLTLLDTKKMLSLKPLFDETVPVADTVLPGVRNWRMLSLWHIPSIFLGITAYSPIICDFIKKETLKNE